MDTGNYEWMSIEKCMNSEIVLSIMFTYLNHGELLAARLVSKKWKRVSDLVVKKRDNFLFLSAEKDFEKMTSKLDEFKRNDDIVIFNKFSIIFEGISLENSIVQRFFDLHGSCITQIKFRFKFDCAPLENSAEYFRKLIEVQLPNLESLQIFGIPTHMWEEQTVFDEDKFGGENKYILPKLNTLGFFSVNGYPQKDVCPLYTNMLHCLPPVRKFSVNWSPQVDLFLSEASVNTKKNRMRNFFSQLKDFSTIYGNKKSQMTQRRPEKCQPISSGNFLYNLARICPKLVKLRLCLGKQVSKRDFEYLMRQLSETLKELELSDHYKRHWNQNNALEIPAENALKSNFSDVVFSKLEVLKIKENIFLSPEIVGELIPKNFPVLTSMKVQYKSEMFDNVKWKGNERHPLQYLVIDGLPVRSEDDFDLSLFSRAFPSLKGLKTNVPNNEVLQSLYVQFPNLEELEIVGGYTDYGICGIPQFHCNNIFHFVEKQNKQTEEFLYYREKVPYIGHMTKLRKLKLVSNLSTMSALYGFAELSSLTHLYVEFCWINDFPMRKIYFLPTLKSLPKLVKLEVSEAYLQPSEWGKIKGIANVRFIPDRNRYLV